MNFYKCELCGNIVTHLASENNKVVCCGKQMTLLTPNTVDAAVEKHVPVYSENANHVIVNVGEVAHPMLENHYITMIAVETDKGVYINKLSPNRQATANFLLNNDEKIVAVYEYCNLHGLWKA